MLLLNVVSYFIVKNFGVTILQIQLVLSLKWGGKIGSTGGAVGRLL
jgi:hypothetical protein